MDIRSNHEKILIVVALTFCAGILFYNAFFIPDISIPSVIYIDSTKDESNLESDEVESQPEENLNTKSNTSSNDRSTKVNINTASAEKLDEKLPGIGPEIAKRIVEYRNSVGKFKSIEEIMNVSGIGEKIFEKFKDVICV